MPVAIRETTRLSEAGPGKSGRMVVHAITAGVGSSGYYSPEVLKEAAANELITEGTPLFLDHASESERVDRPERSVRDIAAVFTGAATYDEVNQALVGEVQVFTPYRELLSEMAPYIGLSISGSATDVTEGDVGGRRVPIVEGLAKIDSTDFVTRAGRGGKVVELLESVRANKRAVRHGVDESTVNDTREELQRALGSAYGDDDRWVYVRDFDESTVWFQVSADGVESMYGQSYTQTDGGAVTLTGEREEVRAVTTYVPVTPTRPGGTTTTQESKEDTMPQIEEARLRELEEAHGRVPTLESERDTAVRERDAAREELAAVKRTDAARKVIGEKSKAARVTFTALEERGLLADLPVKDGQLDTEAFDKAVDDAVTEASTRGATTGVRGFGESAPAGDHVSESQPTTNAWGRPLAVKGA